MSYQNNNQLELSALISADSFFYTLIESQIDPGVIGYSHLREFSSIISGESGGRSIEKSKFAVLNGHFTLIPHAEYDSDHLSSFLIDDVSIDKKKDHIFRSDISEKFDVRIIYSVHNSLIKEINQHVENPSLCHFVTALLDGIGYSEMENSHIEACYVGDQMVVILSEKRRLMLANVFEVSEPVSAIYFLSLVCQNFNLDPNSVSIFLSGAIEEGGPFHEAITKYFGNLHFRDSGFKQKDELTNSHRFFPFSCISQCA